MYHEETGRSSAICIRRRREEVLLFISRGGGRSRVILSGGVMNSAPVSGEVRQWRHEEVMMLYERGRSSFLPEDPPRGTLWGSYGRGREGRGRGHHWRTALGVLFMQDGEVNP